MKKQNHKKICSLIAALIMLVSCFLCMQFSFAGVKNSANSQNIAIAENEDVDEFQPISYQLVPVNWASDTQKEEKYNLSSVNQDSFTPFVFETKSRMPGSAFTFPKEGDDNYYMITNKEVKLQSQTEITKDDSLALVFWVYVDGTDLHNLTLTLTFANGTTLTYNILRNELAALLEKETQAGYPYAYNKFVLPLANGESSGEIYNGNVLYAPTKITINYTSEVVESFGEKNFARLSFYDLKIGISDVSNIAVTEKQDYFVTKINHIDEELKSSFCVGDKYKIPYLSSVVDYAFKGKENLINNNRFTWRVRVFDPDQDNPVSYAFGDTVTFETEGVYKIYYECLNLDEGEVLSSWEAVQVDTINGIYFSKNTLRANVGTNYVIDVDTSTKFSEISEITFDYDQSALDVTYEDDGTVTISAKKEGTYNLTAKVSGKRLLNPEMIEYQCELTVIAKTVSSSNLSYRIFLYVVIAALGLTILITVVILLVKSRKVVVK